MLLRKATDPLRVIVAEDEYLVATDVAAELQAMGAEIVGVKGSVAEVRAVLATGDRVDAVVLDIDLGGELSYALADELIATGVPVIFTTGYDSSAIPTRYADVERCDKPILRTELAAALGRATAKQFVG